MTAHDDAVEAAAEAMRGRLHPELPDAVRLWVAEAAVTAAAPHLLAPVEAEVQRLSEAFIASEAEVARLRNPDLRIVMGYDLGREEGERERDEAVAAALALHQPEGYFTPDGLADDCPTCDVLHPCATYRALTDAGDDAPTTTTED